MSFNMTRCNFTNSTLNCTSAFNFTIQSTTQRPAAAPTPLFIVIVNYMDQINRVFSALVFLIYFVLIIFIKELRKLNLLYVHHANLTGFAFVIMFLFYFDTITAPTFSSPYLNDLFCKITEATWIMLKYLRPYSILLIAAYRFIAVFNNSLFKQLNSSTLNMLIPLVGVWVLSALALVGTKFGFNTTYGNLLCLDGFSAKMENIVNYLIVSSVLSILVPFSLTTIIYVLIKMKLEKNSAKFTQSNASKLTSSLTRTVASTTREISSMRISNLNSSHLDEAQLTRKSKQEWKKNTRLNMQLILLNICYIICFCMSLIFNFRYIIPNFSEKLLYFRQIIRIINILSQAMVPVISLYFNSTISIRGFKQKIFGNCRTTSAVSELNASTNNSTSNRTIIN